MFGAYHIVPEAKYPVLQNWLERLGIVQTKLAFFGGTSRLSKLYICRA